MIVCFSPAQILKECSEILNFLKLYGVSGHEIIRFRLLLVSCPVQTNQTEITENQL